MILINLLPHRERRRQQRKQAFFVGLGLAAVAGTCVVAVGYLWLEQQAGQQQARNGFLSGEIARLDAQVKDIATLRSEIDALKARQKAVEDLQLDRNTPVHLLQELARRTPEGVYLTRIKQVGDIVEVSGLAATNERVSEILRATAGAEWLQRPDLVEIKAVNATAGGRESRRLYEFQMKVSVRRAAAAAAAASGPAAGMPASAGAPPKAPT